MKRQSRSGKLPLAVQILLPLLLALLCGGMLLLASIRPYEIAKTYLRIGFMDSGSTNPNSGASGLNIVETDIDTDYTGATSAEGDVAVSAYGSQCAILECKSAGLYVPVYWGGGSELLEKGACQTPASAVIGSTGNSVISAHVNTFFHDLNQLKKGDTVTLYTTYGKFTYEVSEQIQFQSSNDGCLKQTDDDRLTLYTCEMQLLGSSDTRIGVVCKLTQREFYTDDTKGGTP